MSESRLMEWLERAEEDYRTAVSLDQTDVPVSVCFPAQQCVEKYLRAALVSQGRRVPRIHDLVELAGSLAEVDQRFAELGDGLDQLNPYSVAVRYPGIRVGADRAATALQAMGDLRRQIRCLLGLDQ